MPLPSAAILPELPELPGLPEGARPHPSDPVCPSLEFACETPAGRCSAHAPLAAPACPPLAGAACPPLAGAEGQPGTAFRRLARIACRPAVTARDRRSRPDLATVS